MKAEYTMTDNQLYVLHNYIRNLVLTLHEEEKKTVIKLHATEKGLRIWTPTA